METFFVFKVSFFLSLQREKTNYTKIIRIVPALWL